MTACTNFRRPGWWYERLFVRAKYEYGRLEV